VVLLLYLRDGKRWVVADCSPPPATLPGIVNVDVPGSAAGVALAFVGLAMLAAG